MSSLNKSGAVVVPLQKATNAAEFYLGALAVYILIVFASAYVLYRIWNDVLYERIEGIDSLTFWDAFAILFIPLCFKSVML